MVEISRVERFLVEKSEGEKFMVEKSGVEITFNQRIVVKGIIVNRILKGWLQVGVNYFYKIFHFSPSDL